MPRIALVSAREALPLDEDLPPLADAVRRAGAQVATPCWDDPAVDWSAFDVAVLRSTWDYVERIDEFLGWARALRGADAALQPAGRGGVEHGQALPRAAAPRRRAGRADAVRRAGRGRARPHCGVSRRWRGRAVRRCRAAEFDEFVVKPSIGAGSRDTARYRARRRGQGAAAPRAPGRERSGAARCCSHTSPASTTSARPR